MASTASACNVSKKWVQSSDGGVLRDSILSTSARASLMACTYVSSRIWALLSLLVSVQSRFKARRFGKGAFVSKLFCAKEGLQILCDDCHHVKTQAERKKK